MVVVVTAERVVPAAAFVLPPHLSLVYCVQWESVVAVQVTAGVRVLLGN